MAGCDYRSCDVCGGKAFYDANLNYEDGTGSYAKNRVPYRIAGEQQSPGGDDKWRTRLDYVGDWAVLCDECAKTHKCLIVKIPDGASP